MISKAFLTLNAAVIGLVGLLYLYDPNLLLSRYGMASEGPGMDNMLRSSYGGLFVGVALIFLTGALKSRYSSSAIGFAAIFMGGLAIGRIASILAVGAPPPQIMFLLYYECAAALIATVLFLKSQEAKEATS